MSRKANLNSVIREIFALSGNRCAFPGCEKRLFNEEGVYVAQICHIEAANDKGQRYNSEQTDEQRRAAANLMVLCYEHHKVTDDEDKYPVPVLQKMKKAHEDKFRLQPPVIEEKILTDFKDIIQAQLDDLYNVSADTNITVHDIDTKVDELKRLLTIRPFTAQDKQYAANEKAKIVEYSIAAEPPGAHNNAGNGAVNNMLTAYAGRVQKSLSVTGGASQSVFEVTIENSVSIGVIPVLPAKSTELTDFKTDFETIRHYITDKRFLIIEGDANCGKSVLTKRVTYFFCKEYSESNGRGFVPVLVDLKSFDPSARNLEELIIRELRANKINVSSNEIAGFLADNNFVLIIDSYDECINFESFKADIYSFPRHVPVVITSRSISELHLLRELNPFFLKLGKLTEPEQKKIAKLYLKDSDKVKLFISALGSQEIKGTEGNPLILKLLLLYFSKQNRLTNNIYDLYKFVMDNLLSAENKIPEGISSADIYFEIRKNFLRDFSFYLQVNQTTNIRLESFNEFLTVWLDKNNLSGKTGLSLAIRNNLLLSGFLTVNGEDISFFHRSFQDFFAGENDIAAIASKKLVKKWFCSEYYHTFLKFYFARTRNEKFLRLFRPVRRRWFFYKKLSFITRIENYSACLAIVNTDQEEKQRIVDLVKYLFTRFSESKISSVFFFHISFIAPELFRSLGYLNYRPANELFFELVVPGKSMEEYALKAVGHFVFEPADYNSLLNFSLKAESRYVEYGNIVKQIKTHSAGLGDLVVARYRGTTDESEKSQLQYFLQTHYTNHYLNGVMPARNVFELLLEIQLTTGDFSNSFRGLIRVNDEPELALVYKNLFYQVMQGAFEKEGTSKMKIFALKALLLLMEKDIRFETIIDLGIHDPDDEVALAALIWLPYVYLDKSLESKYLTRLYALYEEFPESRGKILNSVNRVHHEINDTEKALVTRSIHGTTYQEVVTALYLIKKFMLTETLPVLNDFLGNEDYLLKLRCKVMEAMIYLEPQMYLDGFNQKAINAYNEELTNEKNIESIRKLVEDILQYIGDNNTLSILKLILQKTEEDFPNKYVREAYRKKPLNFEYPAWDKSHGDRNLLPSHVSQFIDRLEMKLKHVENYASGTK